MRSASRFLLWLACLALGVRHRNRPRPRRGECVPGRGPLTQSKLENWSRWYSINVERPWTRRN